jgi:hypothetical protein
MSRAHDMKKESANHTRFISGEKGSTSNIYLCSPSRWKQSELSWNHPWIRGPHAVSEPRKNFTIYLQKEAAEGMKFREPVLNQEYQHLCSSWQGVGAPA